MTNSYSIKKTNMNCSEDIIDICLRAGALVLENGGETYRTEETIVRIARSLGALTVSAFVTPTVIMVSFKDSENNTHTSVHRITIRGTNLEKVDRINTLSREITGSMLQTTSCTKIGSGAPVQPSNLSIQEIKNKLLTIEKAPCFTKKLIILMSGFSAAFFALMFGGNFYDATIAFVIGFLLRIVLIALEKVTRNTFTVSLVSGFFTAFLAFLATNIISLIFSPNQIPVSYMQIIVSVLMLVVPGIAITNAMRDMIAGDLVSGTARLFEAFMIAAGLSAGTAAGLLLTGVFL
ncbi:MAG: hypothetical protein BKP49_08785 [Treponema sp. CETP13]|nr:MAG: hypothetical protein BKP49_08785 [Treponema sp. CETP13]